MTRITFSFIDRRIRMQGCETNSHQTEARRSLIHSGIPLLWIHGHWRGILASARVGGRIPAPCEGSLCSGSSPDPPCCSLPPAFWDLSAVTRRRCGLEEFPRRFRRAHGHGIANRDRTLLGPGLSARQTDLRRRSGDSGIAGSLVAVRLHSRRKPPLSLAAETAKLPPTPQSAIQRTRKSKTPHRRGKAPQTRRAPISAAQTHPAVAGSPSLPQSFPGRCQISTTTGRFAPADSTMSVTVWTTSQQRKWRPRQQASQQQIGVVSCLSALAPMSKTL